MFCSFLVIIQLLFAQTSEGKNRTSRETQHVFARACACLSAFFLLPSLPSPDFIHKMRQHHSTIFTLPSCC